MRVGVDRVGPARPVAEQGVALVRRVEHDGGAAEVQVLGRIRTRAVRRGDDLDLVRVVRHLQLVADRLEVGGDPGVVVVALGRPARALENDWCIRARAGALRVAGPAGEPVRDRVGDDDGLQLRADQPGVPSVLRAWVRPGRAVGRLGDQEVGEVCLGRARDVRRAIVDERSTPPDRGADGDELTRGCDDRRRAVQLHRQRGRALPDAADPALTARRRSGRVAGPREHDLGAFGSGRRRKGVDVDAVALDDPGRRTWGRSSTRRRWIRA